jgi:hypothetical protein
MSVHIRTTRQYIPEDVTVFSCNGMFVSMFAQTALKPKVKGENENGE